MEEKQNKSNKSLIITGIIVVIFIVGLLTNGFGIFSHNPSSDYNLTIGNSPVLGNPDAKVTIYEFSDFSCPFCAAANGDNPDAISFLKKADPNWQAPLPLIKSNYIDSGKVKIVFKYYPGHGAGKASQIVGFALQNQNLFWQFHDAAFANQADTGDMEKMKELAKTIGANMTQLNSDLSNNYASRFESDMQMAQSSGIQGTPTFFINGQKIEGAQSYPVFKKIIDAELAR